MFQLKKKEFDNLRSHFGTSNCAKCGALEVTVCDIQVAAGFSRILSRLKEPAQVRIQEVVTICDRLEAGLIARLKSQIAISN